MKQIKVPLGIAAAAMLFGGVAGAAPAQATPLPVVKNVAKTVTPFSTPYVQPVRSVRRFGHRGGGRHFGGRGFRHRDFGGRHFRHRGHRGHWRGGHWVAPLLGLGLLGYGLGAYDYGPDYYYDYDYGYHGSSNAYRRCDRRFKTFDWETGTYMGYDGHRHRCPYL
jgi:hypothetical protein